MRSLATLLVLSALFCHAFAEVDSHGKTSDKLIDLTADSFDGLVVDPRTNKIINNVPWMIMFFAPWCGHCKRLMPTFDDFAEKYGDGRLLHVGRVNCDDGSNSNLCTAYEIGGYPTLLFLKGDNYYDYNSERTVDGLKKFVFDGGYETADSESIPKKLEGMALYQKQAMKFLNQLGRSVQILFHKIGFQSIPVPIQYGIAGSIFAAPIVLMCYVICCMKDEVVEAPSAKRVQEAEQKAPVAAAKPAEKPASGRKRDKIE